MRWLFTLSIFAGSALLFCVQPLIAKQLLPVFGGSPLVWNTSLLFFQIMLLLGYLYAHHSIRLLGFKRQAIIHVVLLACGIAVLPLRVPELVKGMYLRALTDQPGSPMANPAVALLLMLLASVGLPFFALSAGAPTLQRWFSHSSDPSAKDPYFLYAASNLASMVSLLGYPIWFERQFMLPDQSVYWSLAYGGFVLLLGVTAFATTKFQAEEQLAEVQETVEPISGSQKFKWVFLAACPTAMMAGVTSYMTTNVAPLPLLWVAPLALYLITFIVAFSKFPRLDLVKYFAGAGIFPVVIVMLLGKHEALREIPLHLMGFFLAALMCHVEIARTRPPAQQLTEFYVWMSVGGMIGGFFAAIVAPLVFTSLSEYPIAMVGCFLATGISCWKKQPFKYLDLVIPAIGAALLWAIMLEVGPFHPVIGSFHIDDVAHIWPYVALTFMAICAVKPLRLGVLLALFFGVQVIKNDKGEEYLLHERSFFGTLIVKKYEVGGVVYHNLINGTILHGSEGMNEELKDQPITYYNENSGIGQVFLALGDTPLFDKIAVIGLGTGTTAAFGRPGQTLDYYELDPNVVRMAKNPALYTYVTDSKAKVNIKLGDARLRMAEATPGTYGLIAVDAFSSDAIPIHLLTTEAFQMYMKALKPDGVLMVHISNRFMQLGPVVGAICEKLDLKCARCLDSVADDDEERNWRQDKTSDWIMVTRSSATMDAVTKDVLAWEPVETNESIRAWEDGYSNVLSVVRVRN